MKLYVIVKKALSSGLKMAQACHAMAVFRELHPDVYNTWYTESNNIVILEDENLAELASKLKWQALRHTMFLEPDLDNELTAICAEPAAWKQLSTLPLAS